MRIQITARHMETSEALKSHIENRLAKLRGHFDRVIDVDVVLSVEKHRHIAEVALHADGVRIHAKESSMDMYQSVDAVVDKLDEQLRRFRERSNRHAGRQRRRTVAWKESVAKKSEAPSAAGNEPQASTVGDLVRERLTMKPMSPEEAMMQLELLGDDFMVFSNAVTQQVNVIYKREDGRYGLVEPEF